MKIRVKDEWTRLVTYFLLMAFGAYSMVYPIVSFEKASPYWAEVLLGAEFLVAGVLLMIGVAGRKGYRIGGLVVVCLGLFTISVIIAIVGGTRVLSYAFLFAAFAMDSVHEIRLQRRGHKEENEQLSRLLEELQAAQIERNGQ